MASLKNVIQDENGKVGVGIVSPEEKIQLHESSSGQNYIKITNDTTGSTGGNGILLGLNSSEDYIIWNYEATNMRFATSGSERMRITSAGRVGVGTTNPAYKIHGSAAESGWGYSFQNATGDEDVNVYLSHGGGYGIAVDSTENATDKYLLKLAGGTGGGNGIGSITRMIVTTAGNVGIGTTSPQTKLEVDGSTNSFVAHFGQGQDNLDGSWGGISVGYGETSNSLYRKVGIVAEAHGDGAARQHLHFLVDTVSDANSATLSDSKMMIDGFSGNVGIGTTSPASKLHVQGGVGAFNVSDDWHQSSSGTHIFRGSQFDSAINEQSTAVKIFSGNATRAAGNYWGGIAFMHLDPENSGWGGSYAGDHFWIGGRVIDTPGQERSALVFATNNGTTAGTHSSEKMVILPNGNVGIGTASPSQKLHVAGGDSVGIRVSGGTNNRYIDLTSGNLEFYTTSTSGWAMGNIVRKNSDSSVLGYISGGYGEANILTYTYYGGTAYNNAAMYILSSNKNVGIGTTNTYARLSVRATSHNNGISVNRQADTTAAIYIGNDGGNNPILAANNADMLFGRDVSGTFTERMRLTNGGNLGIGTTSPAVKLDVNGSVRVYGGNLDLREPNQEDATNVIYFNANNGNATNDSNDIGTGIVWKPNYTNYSKRSAGIMQIGEGNYFKSGLAFYTNNTSDSSTDWSERMRLDMDGNVGIGTTSPLASLQIGSGTSNTSNRSGVAIFGARNDNAVLDALSLVNTASGANNNGTALNFHNGNTWSPTGRLIVQQNPTGTTTSSNMQFQIFNGVLIEVMRITSDQNVGIGTASPFEKLHVNGRIYVTSNPGSDGIVLAGSGSTNNPYAYITSTNEGVQDVGMAFYVTTDAGTTNTEAIRIDDQGNVGIGTTSPSTKLHVYTTTANDNGGHIQYENANTGTGSATNAQLIGKSKYGTLQYMVWENKGARIGMRSTANSSAGDLYFTVGTDSVSTTMLANGNVGIGTTAPGAKLDVSGEVRSNGGFTTQDGSFTRVLNPGGGAYSGNGGVTGAFKITLPMTWSNTMMRMTVKIFDYSGGESFTIELGGYNYSANSTWYNTFAYTTCDSGTDRNFTVRFGHDGTKNCIYIGEITDAWSYPKIAVVDAQFGHSNIESYRWNDGWDIRMETTAFSSVSSTIQNTQATNWKRTGQDVYYGGGSGRVGIGTTAPTEKLDVYGGKVKISSGSNGYGWIYGEDANHSIILRGDRSGTAGDFSSYHQYGGTLANGKGHLFWTGGVLANQTLRMQIADDGTVFSGNVGIGTSSPGYSLDVQGNGSIIWATGKTSGGTAIIGCKNSNDGSGHEGANVYMRSSGWGEGFVVVGGHSISAQAGRFNINAGGPITFNLSGEQMRVTTTGVGIGTTNPGYKLDVSGGAIAIRGNAAGNSLRFDDSNGNSRNAFYVDTSNYLNIGNANYAGVKFVQTASAPTTGEFAGNQIQQAVGDGSNGVVLAEPSAWLAVRVGTTDYAIPMYTTG